MLPVLLPASLFRWPQMMLLAAGWILSGSAHAWQQDVPASESRKTVRQTVRVGAWIHGGGRGVTNVRIALPVPAEWPEQHVTMFEETMPDEVLKSEYKEVETVRRLLANIPKLGPGEVLELQALFEVTVHGQPYPQRTDHLVLPKRPPRDIRIYLSPSENIESRKLAVRRAATAATEDHELAWDKVRGIYDWVIANVEINRSLEESGAEKAIQNGEGSPEDPSYAFVAMCRNQRIPARMVWAADGEYAEFYLQDDTGEGFWFPVVLEGKPEFGQMTDPRVVFQKGDNIKIPESSRRKLYVTETISGNGKLGSVRWIRDVLPARQR